MNYTIHNGNNIDILKTYPDNSFDSIVTDPPYGIEFLGKDWDSNTGAVETWAECFRVLKPGGYLLAFSAARTYHNLATNIEGVGFEIRDQLMWLYASGFPKAQDVGKAIQRRQGVEEYEGYVGTTKNAGFGQTDHARVRAGAEWSTKETRVGKAKCTSPEAKQWAGWKTALKPAHEPIVMARKPFKGSCIDNVLTHGLGALNIDATRLNDKFPNNVIGEVEGYQKFFFCPKVSRKERHIGHETPPAMFGHMQGAYDEKGQRYAVELDKRTEDVGNNHPTVKPVELMKYLIKLVTPPNSTVLDPFNGSGSTGMAAVELGHTYIGCELDPTYVDIAKRRIEAWNTPEEPTLNTDFFKE